MRPQKYTDAQVIAAGQQISALGKAVTAYALRAILGGGDPKRLYSVWEKHAVTNPGVTSLPWADEIQRMEHDFSSRLSAMAFRIHSTATEAASLTSKTLEAELAELLRENERHILSNSEKDRRIEDLESSLEETLSAKNKLEAERSDSAVVADRLLRYERDVIKLGAQVENLRQQSGEQSATNAQQRSELDAIKKDRDRLLLTLDAVTDELQNKKVEISRLNENADRLREKISDQASRIEEQRMVIHRTTNSLKSTEKA